jgi:hypothetical protein
MEEATTWRQWVKGVKKLRTLVTADANGDASGPNFGDTSQRSTICAFPVGTCRQMALD